MSTIPLRISAQDATQAARNWQAQMNRSRQIPQIPQMILDQAQEKRIFIYNVGPWPQMRMMGSLGNFMIPACAPNRAYSEPVIIPGIVIELYPTDETQFTAHFNEGIEVANAILGIGPHTAPASCLDQYGCFISPTEKPSRELLDQARTKLNKRLREYVDEANIAHSKGPAEAQITIRPEIHFMAARLLNLTVTECPWLERATEAAERAACEACGSTYVKGVKLCPSCGFVLDQVWYEKNKEKFVPKR